MALPKSAILAILKIWRRRISNNCNLTLVNLLKCIVYQFSALIQILFSNPTHFLFIIQFYSISFAPFPNPILFCPNQILFFLIEFFWP